MPSSTILTSAKQRSAHPGCPAGLIPVQHQGITKRRRYHESLLGASRTFVRSFFPHATPPKSSYQRVRDASSTVQRLSYTVLHAITLGRRKLEKIEYNELALTYCRREASRPLPARSSCRLPEGKKKRDKAGKTRETHLERRTCHPALELHLIRSLQTLSLEVQSHKINKHVRVGRADVKRKAEGAEHGGKGGAPLLVDTRQSGFVDYQQFNTETFRSGRVFRWLRHERAILLVQ